MEDKVSAAQALAALKNCYREYIEGYQELQAGITVQDILAGWVGGGKVKEQQGALYEQYFTKGRSCVDDLCAAVKDLGAEEAETWVQKGIEVILFYKQTDSDLNIMLIAMETLAEPLIPLLDQAAAKELLEQYRKRTPKYRMLPNQSKLLKLMKKNA